MILKRETLCNVVRSLYPKAFGIRKSLQRLKIKRLRRFMLTPKEVHRCEENPELISDCIAPYLLRYKGQKDILDCNDRILLSQCVPALYAYKPIEEDYPSPFLDCRTHRTR